MDFSDGNKSEAVGRLATRLLARDPVEFNSAINSTFTPDVTYRGHGLEIRGATNLKHAAWFWNKIDSGKPATFTLKDIQWDEQKQSAQIQTVRFVRPTLFPFFGFAVQVPVELQLTSTGGKAYVSRFEEKWFVERILSYASVVQAIHEALVKNIWTLFVLTLSNLTFAAFAKVHSIDAVDRAKKSLPSDVVDGINSGFTQGSEIAQGYGQTVVNLAHSIAYPFIRLSESFAQAGTLAVNRVAPFPLPYPYVYDVHALPPNVAAPTISETEAAPIEEKSGSSLPSQDDAPQSESTASVIVAPSIDGEDQGKTVSIESRISTDAKDKAAKATNGTNGSSLYDQLRKEGEDPIAEAAKLEAKIEQNGTHTAHSSGDDEGVKESQHANGNGGGKKKKNKKKKNTSPNGSHQSAPTFKEGLAQTEAK
ncbi:uncharacterized protein FA14DRAFT_191149 [Meira miltonrushii]|uniref:Uncharacterized protein n=1 Tax=Meira miltonrushii TaxID=1280837 RepID=A0A316V955_9BASI|nr:uncharacterized protein FA14DRAFT_191149 [Meira miltonrushii]PWN34056.1 hypothetical protein FA14DRAFT_191149 [Meira miltonrushii]